MSPADSGAASLTGDGAADDWEGPGFIPHGLQLEGKKDCCQVCLVTARDDGLLLGLSTRQLPVEAVEAWSLHVTMACYLVSA